MKIEEFNIIKNHPVLHEHRLTEYLLESNIRDSSPDLDALNGIFETMRDEIDYLAPFILQAQNGIRIFAACKNRQLDFYVCAGIMFEQITFWRQDKRVSFHNQDLAAIQTFLNEYVKGSRPWT